MTVLAAATAGPQVDGLFDTPDGTGPRQALVAAPAAPATGGVSLPPSAATGTKAGPVAGPESQAPVEIEPSPVPVLVSATETDSGSGGLADETTTGTGAGDQADVPSRDLVLAATLPPPDAPPPPLAGEPPRDLVTAGTAARRPRHPIRRPRRRLIRRHHRPRPTLKRISWRRRPARRRRASRRPRRGTACAGGTAGRELAERACSVDAAPAPEAPVDSTATP